MMCSIYKKTWWRRTNQDYVPYLGAVVYIMLRFIYIYCTYIYIFLYKYVYIYVYNINVFMCIYI